MFARFADALRGARKSELFIILALICVVALALFSQTTKSGASTDIERRMECILEKISGAGEVQVMITQTQSGEPLGILIVAEGAGNIPTRLEMLRAVKTLLGVDTDKIEIIEMRRDAG